MSPVGSPTLRISGGGPVFPDDDDDEYSVFVNADFIEFVEKLCEHPATWELFPIEGKSTVVNHDSFSN